MILIEGQHCCHLKASTYYLIRSYRLSKISDTNHLNQNTKCFSKPRRVGLYYEPSQLSSTPPRGLEGAREFATKQTKPKSNQAYGVKDETEEKKERGRKTADDFQEGPISYSRAVSSWRRVARVKTGADLSARRDRDVHGRSSSKEDVPLWLSTNRSLSSPFSRG